MPAEENVFLASLKKVAARFWSLIATQFQGAFNDTAQVLCHLPDPGTNPTASEKDLLVFALKSLRLPFLLFSMAGGFLADRFSKRSVTIATKIFEVCAMLFAMYAFTRATRAWPTR